MIATGLLPSCTIILYKKIDTLQLHKNAESNTTVTQNEPTDCLVHTFPQQPVPAARQFFTYETFYVWSFRFVVR